MSKDTSNKKRPIIAAIIAVLLLISVPFIIINCLSFLQDPLKNNKVFAALPVISQKILSQKAPYAAGSEKLNEFLNLLSTNMQDEYTAAMNDNSGDMRKIEAYKAASQLVIAIATIFICIGILRIRKWAYNLVLIRLIVSLFLVVPLMHFSFKHMNTVTVNAINKSLTEYSEFRNNDKIVEILKVIVQDKVKKQSLIPDIAGVVWYVSLLGYFLSPGVRRTFSDK